MPYQKHIILGLRFCHNRLVSGRNYTLLCHNTEQDLHHFFKKAKKVTSVSLRWSSQESRHNKQYSRPSRKLSIFVLGLSRVRNVCLWRLLWRCSWFTGSLVTNTCTPQKNAQHYLSCPCDSPFETVTWHCIINACGKTSLEVTNVHPTKFWSCVTKLTKTMTTKTGTDFV